MDDFQKDANIHLKIVKAFLSIVGLGPYDDSWVVYAKRFLYTFTITVEFVFQFLGFLDEESTRDNVVNFATNTTFYLILLTKYLCFLSNIANIRVLFDTVETQRNEITDPEERKIIYAQDIDADWWNRLFTSNNGSQGTRATVERIFSQGHMATRFQVVVFLNAGCLTSYNLLGIYFPGNWAPGVKLYYFPTNPKLSCLMLLHMFACAILPCSAILGSDGTAFITMLHAAGLFRITKHRCDVAFDKSDDLPPVERQEVETRNILGIVKLHQQGAELIKFIYATCWKMYFSTQGPIVVATSLCMARAYDYIKLQPSLEIRESFVHLTLVPLILFYSYIINNICQTCLDASGDVFWSLSDAPWYKGTIASQKMTLFLLQHCKPIGFTFAGGYQANLEGFSVNVKLAFSYFTVVASM